MCGYDPFRWYDEELDREHEAYMNGYDSYEEYRETIEEHIGENQYDDMKCERYFNENN